ncbi:MAG: GTPase ObgE [Clostridia bacterium]|nr:GTPase ObgE [Clostridia bacterium]MBR2969003.1 GTPase ObgE [Clostridia bacterium]
MFVDREVISIKSGDGGDGMTSFMRFKGIATGGPDGGDGGDGGSIYFVGDKSKSSLIDFQYTHKYSAENGGKGDTNNCHGRNGADKYIAVPPGTVIKDRDSNRIIADVYYDGQVVKVLEGGRGGKGNVRFATSKRHTPHFSQKGEKTPVRYVVLELKVIADVGLVGFPNVGKSTMLSKISGAKPKIANYHFTTISPNLGVVKHYDDTFIVADIPGLIEGAAEGAGLGHDFLRHIERTRMLVHVVDISGVEGRDPIDDFIKINAELAGYSDLLAELPQIVMANKCDMYGAEENLKAFKKKFGRKYKIFPCSAISAEGLGAVLDEVSEVLKTLPEPAPIEHDLFTYERPNSNNFEIERDEDGAFVVFGPLVDMLIRNVVLDDYDSLAYMQKTLRDKGVIKELRKLGAKDGDVVVIGDVEFDFID